MNSCVYLLCLLLSLTQQSVIGFVLLYNASLERGAPISYIGNDSHLSLINLRGTLYKESLTKLTNVTELFLGFDDLIGIEEGAICPPLKPEAISIWIQNAKNETFTFKKRHFKNCDNLSRLDIKAITDTKLDQDALDHLKNLKLLYVTSVNLEDFNKRLFKNLKLLEELHITHSKVIKLQDDTFQYVPQLKYLDIFVTKIESFPKKIFKNLNKLEVLTLYKNELSDVMWENFSGLSSLKWLIIKQNNITYFDTDKIAKYMPKLEFFSFQTNPVNCQKKEDIKMELASKLGQYITIEYTSHPIWFDPCS